VRPSESGTHAADEVAVAVEARLLASHLREPVLLLDRQTAA
jgi:hypothetical protein